jgi:hypothetical protein
VKSGTGFCLWVSVSDPRPEMAAKMKWNSTDCPSELFRVKSMCCLGVRVTVRGGDYMLTTFAFDVCHDVYCAAREAIDSKIPTLNAEISGKYQWHPDRLPRLAEYVCDFARAGERALGGGERSSVAGRACRVYGNQQAKACSTLRAAGSAFRASPSHTALGASPSHTALRASPSLTALRASRLALFRVYYLGGADYQAARRHLGISEFTWADWAEEIRRVVGRELANAGVFPPSKYFREASEEAS